MEERTLEQELNADIEKIQESFFNDEHRESELQQVFDKVYSANDLGYNRLLVVQLTHAAIRFGVQQFFSMISTEEEPDNVIEHESISENVGIASELGSAFDDESSAQINSIDELVNDINGNSEKVKIWKDENDKWKWQIGDLDKSCNFPPYALKTPYIAVGTLVERLITVVLTIDELPYQVTEE